MAEKMRKIIRNEGSDNNVLVYKTAINDFGCESVLIVDESEQALIYKDGQAEGPYKSGKYVLPTDDPKKFRGFFARLFRRKETSEAAPITCDVYFVNTVVDLSVMWGTPKRFPVKDPVYNEIVEVGANGSVKVKISMSL